MQKLYGTVVPIVTPLTEEDTIDVESLKNLVNHVIDGGLQCLYPCGTTGEMMYLTVEERKQVAEVTVKEAATLMDMTQEEFLAKSKTIS